VGSAPARYFTADSSMSSAWFTLTGVGVVLTWVVTSIQMLKRSGGCLDERA
jgi:hypothetical protein